MGDDSEWIKCSMEDKCLHKIWKARLAGYEELATLFNSLDNDKSPEFSRYAGLLMKVVSDSNALTQEKGLDCVIAYLENASTAISARTIGEVMSCVMTKCLSATKQKTKEKAAEVIMLYFELDKPDIVQDCLMSGLVNKNPKVVIGTIQCLREALKVFGTKVVQVKPLLKMLPKLLDDRDKNVREEAKQLVIELYRWIGSALKPQMSNFRPIQVQEFEVEFESVPPGRPSQTRFMRSQHVFKAKMEADLAAASNGGGDNDAGDEEEEVDQYDLMIAVEIISQIPKDFYEKIEAKKWQERREALESLHKLTSLPKIENGTFGTLINALMKVIGKDTNVMLVTLAANCLCGLAKGLQNHFSIYAANCMSVVIEKFREKKATVVAALRDASDAICSSVVSFEVFVDDIVAALNNKNPSVRGEMALLLSRCFLRSTQSSLPKKLLKAYCCPLIKAINDTDPMVREASCEALAVAIKVVSEKYVMPFLIDADPIKVQRIQEKSHSVVLLNAKGEPRVSGSNPAAQESQTKVLTGAFSHPVAAAKSSTAKLDSVTKKSSSRCLNKKVIKRGSGCSKKDACRDKAEIRPEVFTEEELEEKASSIFPADTILGFSNSNWKERLSSVEKLLNVVKSMEKSDLPCQVFVHLLMKGSGLKDSNFQVLKQKLELIGYLAQNAHFSQQSAGCVMGDIVEKISDVKTGDAAQEALSCISEACSLEFVSAQVMAAAFEQKNPKTQSEAMNWVTGAIKDFGFKIPIKQMIASVNKGLSASNPAVRQASINVLSTAYMYMGPKLRVFFENEKPALLQQIDAKFEKVKDMKLPAPTRGVNLVDVDEEIEGIDHRREEEEIQHIVPRVDIGDQITDDLLAIIADKNWKIRNEGLQKVMEILKEAKFITANIGGLPASLKARIGDVNKNLQMTSIGICSTLAIAMGPFCKQHTRVIVPGLISCLSDSKVQLRSAVINTLNLWVEQTTLGPLVECEAIVDALRADHPFIRSELLGWLAEKLPACKVLPPELKDCVVPLLCCLEDRNMDVRKRANDAVSPFMNHVGYGCFVKAVGNLKPSSKDPIQQLLDKAREQLPVKAPPAKRKEESSKTAALPPSNTGGDDDKQSSGIKQDVKDEKAGSKTRVAVKAKGKTAGSGGKKNPEKDSGLMMYVNVPVQQRIKDEKNMKVLKWNFSELRAEYTQQLRVQMEKNFSPDFMAQLFHADFKFHIKAIEQLIGWLEHTGKETIGNMDLILKWCTVRFFDTNPSMINKALEYIRCLFMHLALHECQLSDLDASSFIPYLILKVGDSKDNVRRDVRNILKLICKVYPASKIFSFLLDGLKSKNSKQRMECLEELDCLIEQYGICICQPTAAQALKTIAGQIGDRDTGVRNASLNAIVTAYTVAGEGVCKFVGQLIEKDQSLLDERIKRSVKGKLAAKSSVVDDLSQATPALTANKKILTQQRPCIVPKTLSRENRDQYALTVDTAPSEAVELPKLIDCDLDYISEPLVRPEIRSLPMLRHLTSSEATATVSYIISQVTSTDITISIQSLAQVDEMLRDRSRAEALLGHVDKLLLMLSMLFRMAHSTHLTNPDVSEEDVVRLCRCLLGTLCELFQSSSRLGRQASKDVLRDIIMNLVTLLLDNRLMELKEGPQVVRSFNVTVVKIIENSDFTNIMGALIRLLQDCLSKENSSAIFVRTVMKCLWRMISMLANTNQDVNLDNILLDVHLFMKAFPCHVWKKRASDQPIRTIKTILHKLAVLNGSEILNHISLLDSDSEVEVYLSKVLKDLDRDGRSSVISTVSLSKSKDQCSGMHDMLSEIFKKIGSKENTNEGLNNLYDFKLKHPEADLEPFLRKVSHDFHEYLEKRLKQIEEERSERCVVKSPVARKALNLDFVSSDYRQRLSVIRAECGLDALPVNNNVDKLTSVPKPTGLEQSQSSPVHTNTLLDTENKRPIPVTKSDIITTSQQKSTADLSELKRRLEKIKQMSSST